MLGLCARAPGVRVARVSALSSRGFGRRFIHAPRAPPRSRRRSNASRLTRAAVEDGQLVTIHYVLTFSDGEVADDTRARDAPATLPIGQGQLFPKLEEGIKQMSPGEKRTFELECADAYGERKEEAIQKFPASPEEVESLKAQVQPGQPVQLPNGATAVCVALEEDGIVLDQIHPLAGKDLTFAVELVSVSNGPELFGVPIVPFDVNKLVT